MVVINVTNVTYSFSTRFMWRVARVKSLATVLGHELSRINKSKINNFIMSINL